MEIKPLAFTDQLRMLRGSEPILPKAIEPKDGAEKPSFFDVLKDQVENVNKLGLDAEKTIDRAIRGEEVNPHATTIAIQKADISFRLLMTVKERLVQTYQELIRTQIG